MNSLLCHRPYSPPRRSFLLLAGVIALAVGTSAHAAPPDPHAGHHAHTPADAGAAAAPAQRWVADLPLRQGMAAIRVAVDALAHGEHGHLDAKQTVALAGQIETQVGRIVAECKLEPRADAALHVIIARLMQGASALKADPANTAAIASLREALQAYPKQFDDPDWPAASKLAH